MRLTKEIMGKPKVKRSVSLGENLNGRDETRTYVS